MAKLTTLKNRYTKEVVYPVTSVNAVFCQDGIDLETRLINDKQLITSLLSNVVAREVIDSSNLPDIDTYTREELKKDLFIDQWNSAWGAYGKYDPVNAPDAEHPFMGNEIWMTYKEAIRVLQNSVKYTSTYTDLYYHKYPACRTLLPTIMYGSRETCSHMYGYCTTEEALRVRSGYGDVIRPGVVLNMFYNCSSLKIVYGVIDVEVVTSTINLAYNATSLEELYIKNLRSNFILLSSPKIKIDCIKYMIQNAVNTSPIIITVHPSVYAKLTDETNVEWNLVLIDATAKNISFATT